MDRQVQLQLLPEEKENEGDPAMQGEGWQAKELASPFEVEKPVLDEAEKWVLAAYLRGEARAIVERRPGSITNAQLSLCFPS